MDLKTNSIIELKIEYLDDMFQGIGFIDSKKIIVNKVLKGETVSAKIIGFKDNEYYAELLKVIKPSLDRITPLCQNFNQCGGKDPC
jgi:23S rRNA (uracil1939-C5)-methyltransferase